MVYESFPGYSLNRISLRILAWALGGTWHTYNKGINTKASQEAKPGEPTGTFRQGPLDPSSHPCVWRSVLGRIKVESQFCHLRAAWPWANHYTSLDLHFPHLQLQGDLCLNSCLISAQAGEGTGNPMRSGLQKGIKSSNGVWFMQETDCHPMLPLVGSGVTAFPMGISATWLLPSKAAIRPWAPDRVHYLLLDSDPAVLQAQ